jgi:hypothetical protein
MIGSLFDVPLEAVDTHEIERKISELEMIVEYLKEEIALRTNKGFKYGYRTAEGYTGFDSFADAALAIKSEPWYRDLPEEDRPYRIHKVYL